MDINRLIRKIRMSIGLNGVLKDLVSDDELAEIIDLRTRETFSRYFKHVFIIKNMMFNEDNKSHQDPYKFRLPEKVVKTIEQMEISINGVKDIQNVGEKSGKTIVGDNLMHLPNRSRYRDNLPFMGSHHVRAGYNQARNDILKSPMEIEFMEPYFIYIKRDYYDIKNNVYDLELFSDHPKNLSTIKDSYAETFEKLAELDVKIVLWENYVSYLNDLDMGHSRVQLKKENWQNAKQERDEMIDQFSVYALYDYPTTIVL